MAGFSGEIEDDAVEGLGAEGWAVEGGSAAVGGVRSEGGNRL